MSYQCSNKFKSTSFSNVGGKKKITNEAAPAPSEKQTTLDNSPAETQQIQPKAAVAENIEPVAKANVPAAVENNNNIIIENTIPSKPSIVGRSGFKLPTMEEVRSGSYVPPVVVKEEEKELPNDAYQESDFITFWNESIQKLKDRNLVSLNSLLEHLDPKHIGDFQYEICVSNKIQSDLFLTEKGAINQHLRASLNNHLIDFKITINQDLSANKPYTTSEKFKAMAEKKPILLSLKDKLGLDSEY